MTRFSFLRWRHKYEAGLLLIVLFCIPVLVKAVNLVRPKQAATLNLPCKPEIDLPVAKGTPFERYWYSNSYGWFDTSHFGAGKPEKVIADVQTAVFNGGGVITITQDVRDGFMGYTASYAISGAVSEKELISVAQGIFLDWSIRFEEWQHELPHGLAAQFTSYSIEDLPSHYLSFFAAANQMDYSSVFACYLGSVTTTDEAPPHLAVGDGADSNSLPEVAKLQNRTFIPLVENEDGIWIHVRWPKSMRMTAVTAEENKWAFVSDETWYFEKGINN